MCVYDLWLVLCLMIPYLHASYAVIHTHLHVHVYRYLIVSYLHECMSNQMIKDMNLHLHTYIHTYLLTEICTYFNVFVSPWWWCFCFFINFLPSFLTSFLTSIFLVTCLRDDGCYLTYCHLSLVKLPLTMPRKGDMAMKW